MTKTDKKSPLGASLLRLPKAKFFSIDPDGQRQNQGTGIYDKLNSGIP